VLSVAVEAHYYGRFYPSPLLPAPQTHPRLHRSMDQEKYKRLRTAPRKAPCFIPEVALREPSLFAHWQTGALPDGWTMGAG
jgi:RNA-directed DNA polymerase